MREIKAVLIAAILFLVIFAVVLLSKEKAFSPEDSFNASRKVGNDSVYRVIDGDTFELGSGERVRLICTDAPELGQFGYPEAKEFLSELILGKSVRLEKDVSERDAYGRLLRYAYIKDEAGEIFVNKEIVKRHYASVFRYGNDTKRCDEIEGYSS